MSGKLGTASIPLFACATLLIAIVLHVLSFASAFWASDKIGDFGLWRHTQCYEAGGSEACAKLRFADTRSEDWFDAVRGLECLTIIFWSFPIVIVPIYMYTALGLHYRCMMGCMTVLSFLGFGCNLAGVIIFGLKINDNDDLEPKWCIYVAGIGGIVGIVAFVLFLLSTCFRPIFTSSTFLMSGLYIDPHKDRMYVIENTDDLKSEGGQVNPAMEG